MSARTSARASSRSPPPPPSSPSRAIPADACVIEVGLGGRFDATNVLERPAACGIATLGIDHEAFLLVPEDGVPAGPDVPHRVREGRHRPPRLAAGHAGLSRGGRARRSSAAPGWRARRCTCAGYDWWAEVGDAIDYRDRHGDLTLPLPQLPGRTRATTPRWRWRCCATRTASTVSPAAMAEGIRAARWPARLQLLGAGPLTALAPGREVWLDGGHNADAGRAIGAPFRRPAAAPGHRHARQPLLRRRSSTRSKAASPASPRCRSRAARATAPRLTAAARSGRPTSPRAARLARRRPAGADRRLALPRRQSARRERRDSGLGLSRRTAIPRPSAWRHLRSTTDGRALARLVEDVAAAAVRSNFRPTSSSVLPHRDPESVEAQPA